MNIDITEDHDEGSMTALITLDLSAAFDVIDHSKLLKHLECSFGLKGNTLTRHIRLWITQNLLKLSNDRTNMIYLVSEHYVKSLKHQQYRFLHLPLALMGM